MEEREREVASGFRCPVNCIEGHFMTRGRERRDGASDEGEGGKRERERERGRKRERG